MPISHPEQARSQLGLTERNTDVLNARRRRPDQRAPYDESGSSTRLVSIAVAMSIAVALVLLVLWLATV